MTPVGLQRLPPLLGRDDRAEAMLVAESLTETFEPVTQLMRLAATHVDEA